MALWQNIIWILFKIYLIIQTFKYYCIPEDNKDKFNIIFLLVYSGIKA